METLAEALLNIGVSEDEANDLMAKFKRISPSALDAFMPVLIQQFQLRREVDTLITKTLAEMGLEDDEAKV
jgi:hypothetical protein